jgi:uncharacterized protein YabN with tetrapyrrole methylase and pyrophosphatase domain
MIPRFNDHTLMGTFNGSSLKIDPKTGFLGAGDNPKHSCRTKFTPALKEKILTILEKEWPNLSKACRQIGISRSTFVDHYNVDERFKECVDAIQNQYIDALEQKQMKFAFRFQGMVDRRAILTAFRSERYNPRIKVEVEHSLKNLDERSRVLSEAIDAEVIETVRSLKKAS